MKKLLIILTFCAAFFQAHAQHHFHNDQDFRGKATGQAAVNDSGFVTLGQFKDTLNGKVLVDTTVDAVDLSDLLIDDDNFSDTTTLSSNKINETLVNLSPASTQDGYININGAILSASASISGTVNADRLITDDFQSNGNVSFKDSIITSNYTLQKSDFLLISNSSSNTTITLPTTGFSGSKFIIIKNIGTGTITLTNTYTDDPTTVNTGEIRQLMEVLIGGTFYWLKVN